MNRRDISRPALWITAVYLVLSILWILVSDYLVLHSFFSNGEAAELSQFQSWKGALFVIGTAALIYVLMRRALFRQSQAENRYHQLVEKVPVGIYHSDPRWTLTFCNTECQRLTQLPSSTKKKPGAEETGHPFPNIHPQDRERISTLRRQAVRQQEPFCAEYRLAGADGTPTWIIDSAQPELDSDGTLTGFIGTLTDITESKLARQHEEDLQKRLRLAVASGSVGLWDLSLENNEVYYSEEWKRQLGYEGEEIDSRLSEWQNRLHPEDIERILKQFREFLRHPDGEMRSEVRLRHRDGSYRWFISRGTIQYDDSGRPAHVIGANIDIDRLKRKEEALRTSREQIDHLLEASPTILYGLKLRNEKPVSSWISESLTRILGYSVESAREPGWWREHLHPEDRSGAVTAARRLLTEDSLEQDYRFFDSQGEVRWIRDQARTLRGKDDEVLEIIGSWNDVTEQYRNEANLERLTHNDALTGLPNRLLLTSRLEHAVSQAARHRKTLAVLYIDLADFKSINESMGHSFGDEILLAVARRFQSRVRAEDTLARLGSDEFLLLLEDLDHHSSAGLVANELLATLGGSFHLSNEVEVFVEACIGIAIYPDNGMSSETLLRSADTAVHRAKQMGRNRLCFYTEEMGAEVVDQLEIQTALRNALQRDELLLHYQPKLDLSTGRVIGAEALIRWQRPGESKLTPPNRFIPVAEKSGLIKPIGDWVIEAACRQIRSWLDEGLEPINVAVNVSVRQFHSQDLHRIVLSALKKYNLEPHLLGLEITESGLMERPAEVSKILGILKQAGVQVALDDFGTGFSSISYLSKFPLDALKIDASFVEGIAVDLQGRNLVNSIIDLAHNIGLKTVAEGVETAEQLDYLRQKNCDQMQGYFFSRPVSASDYAALLRDGSSLAHPGGNPGSL